MNRPKQYRAGKPVKLNSLIAQITPINKMPFPLNKQDKCQCIKLVCVSKEQIASLKLNSYALMNSWWFSVSSIAKCQSSAHQQQNNGRAIQSSSECKSLARRRVEDASAMILTRQLIITSCHGHWDDFFQLTC